MINLKNLKIKIDDVPIPVHDLNKDKNSLTKSKIKEVNHEKKGENLNDINHFNHKKRNIKINLNHLNPLSGPLAELEKAVIQMEKANMKVENFKKKEGIIDNVEKKLNSKLEKALTQLLVTEKGHKSKNFMKIDEPSKNRETELKKLEKLEIQALSKNEKVLQEIRLISEEENYTFYMSLGILIFAILLLIIFVFIHCITSKKDKLKNYNDSKFLEDGNDRTFY